jgi:hypothetical protein
VTTATAGVSRPSDTAARRPALAWWPLSTDLTAAMGLFAATLIFYFPLVFMGRTLVDYDAFVYFIPQRVFLAKSLLAGQIPLWDPHLFLGAPFLANPQTAVLYPLSWLFVLGAPESIYTVQLVVHGFLAAFFLYLLMRRAFAVHPLAATLSGLAYAFGGFAVGQVGHLNQISAASWLPAVLLAYDRFTATRRPYWIGLGAIALALQLFAGHPQETYMTVIVLGIYGAVMAPWRNRRRLAICALGGVALCSLGAALAAAQLLPTLELTPLSIRGEGVDWKDAVAGSLPSYLAVRALFPPFWVTVTNTEYLGYAGVTPMVLGFLALLYSRSRGVLFGALIAALGLILALGENSGAYQFAFNAVPGFDTFRVPARWLLLWEFGVAILGGLGADWVARGARVDLKRRDLWPRVLLVAVILVMGLAWQLDEGEEFVTRRTPLAFATLAVATLAIGGLPHLGRPVLAAGLLVGLTGAELWLAAESSPARQGAPMVYSAGETVDWLRAHDVTDQDRILSMARPEYVPAREADVRAALGGLPASAVNSVLVAQKWHDTLTPNVPMQYGLSTADGYDGGVLPLQRWLQLSSLIVQSPRPDGVLLTRLDQLPSDRQLDLLGVRYLIANASTQGRPGMQTTDFGDLRLFARTEPVPRSLLVFGTTPVADDAGALDRMAHADFDSNREVVLEAGQAGAAADGAAPAEATPGVAVTPDVTDADRWHARVTVPRAGYLLQREAWYPGWQARVDGTSAPLLRADLLYRAVPLPAGEHDVEIYFDSTSFKRGLAISLAGLVGVMILLTWGWLLPIMRTSVQR